MCDIIKFVASLLLIGTLLFGNSPLNMTHCEELQRQASQQMVEIVTYEDKRPPMTTSDEIDTTTTTIDVTYNDAP